jgi:hypothetical protein
VISVWAGPRGGVYVRCHGTQAAADILFLPVPDEDLPPSIRHDCPDSHEVPYWSEAADGDVALWVTLESIYGFLRGGVLRSVGEADLVLDGFISAGRGEVLRHLVRCGVCCDGDGGEGEMEVNWEVNGVSIRGAGAKKRDNT